MACEVCDTVVHTRDCEEDHLGVRLVPVGFVAYGTEEKNSKKRSELVEAYNAQVRREKEEHEKAMRLLEDRRKKKEEEKKSVLGCFFIFFLLLIAVFLILLIAHQ